MAENIRYFGETKKSLVPSFVRNLISNVFSPVKKVISEKLKANEEKIYKRVIKPLSVFDDFNYDPDKLKNTEPFASKEEYYSSRTGSEHTAIMTTSESIVSKRFVQCSGAIVRNRKTGLISLVHQSLWSMAAETAIAMQCNDDLDLIVLDPRKNEDSIREDVEIAHDNGYQGGFGGFLESDERVIESNGTFHTFGTGEPFGQKFGHITGISEVELNKMIERSKNPDPDGETNYLGTIELPISRENITTTTILYRPSENLIYVMNYKTKQLFVFPGFPEMDK